MSVTCDPTLADLSGDPLHAGRAPRFVGRAVDAAAMAVGCFVVGRVVSLVVDLIRFAPFG